MIVYKKAWCFVFCAFFAQRLVEAQFDRYFLQAFAYVTPVVTVVFVPISIMGGKNLIEQFVTAPFVGVAAGVYVGTVYACYKDYKDYFNKNNNPHQRSPQ